MSSHSIRSPSAADFWGNCPGGPAYVESLGVTREAGPAAEWGTMCHGIAETAVRIAFKMTGVGELVFPKADEPAREVVEFYVNQIVIPEEPLCDCSAGDWLVGVEDRVLSAHLPDSAGTIDFWAYCPVHQWLRVVDLKTGHGEVEAEDNPQCAIYGLQRALTLGRPVSRVVIEIIQPRSPSGRQVKRWELRPIELLDMLPVFQKKVAASLAPDAPLIAGEKQCKYCPGAAVCPERRKAITRSAVIQFGVKAQPTGEEIAEALALVPQVREWAKSVESFAYQAANNGMRIPGYKLVAKQDGDREWIDEDEAGPLLNSIDNEAPIYTVSRLKSPAQLEKIFGKKVINPLTRREPGKGTVLVEESNKREAVTVDKLATFQHLLNPS